MSDTPRTDKLLHLLAGIAAVKEVPSLVEHARQLERENWELVEALRPFVALLQEHHDRKPDSQPIFGINSATIYLGQIRAVSALLARLDK